MALLKFTGYALTIDNHPKEDGEIKAIETLRADCQAAHLSVSVRILVNVNLMLSIRKDELQTDECDVNKNLFEKYS